MEDTPIWPGPYDSSAYDEESVLDFTYFEAEDIPVNLQMIPDERFWTEDATHEVYVMNEEDYNHCAKESLQDVIHFCDDLDEKVVTTMTK